MATHAFALTEPPQAPGERGGGAGNKGKKEGPLKRRLTIAQRSHTRGSIHNPDEVQEAVRRARSLKQSDLPTSPGKNIAETLLEITANVSEQLKEHYLLPWEKEGASEPPKAAIKPVVMQDVKALEGAALKIQCAHRRRTAIREYQSRKLRKSMIVSNVDIDHQEKLQELSSAKIGDWHPSEVRIAIKELLERLNTDETEQSLEATNDVIQARVRNEGDTDTYCTWLEETAKKVLECSDKWHNETINRLETADVKSSLKIKSVWESGIGMIELGKKAVAERERLKKQLETDKRLHLGDQDRKKLEDKRQLVAQLGNRLVEIRYAEEAGVKTSGGSKEQNSKIEELKTQISEKEAGLKTLTNYFETIEKYVRILEVTYEYLEHEHEGAMPEEGVLETIEEVKSIVRRDKIAPLLRRQDEEHAEVFTPPDMTAIIALEAEIARLRGLLTGVEDRIAALSSPADHNEKVISRLAQICGAFDTATGTLEPSDVPDVVPEIAEAFQEALLAHIQTTHEQLKPGLKNLTRFENLLQNALRSLELFASQRVAFLSHVRSLKDNLVRDTESIAVGAGENGSLVQPQLSRLHDKEERLRQTIQAFHDGEDAICGGVEEVNARLDFTREIVNDALRTADRLRNHCDRNRWEIQDILGAPVEAVRTTALPDPELASFTQDPEDLMEGAARVRTQRWEEDLAQRKEVGKMAASAAREMHATKSAITAEVEARAAMDWLDDEMEEADIVSDVRSEFEDSGEEEDVADAKPQKLSVTFGPEVDGDTENGGTTEGKDSAKRFQAAKTRRKGAGQRIRDAAAAQALDPNRRSSPRGSQSRRSSQQQFFEAVSPRGSIINLPGASRSPPFPDLPPPVRDAADIVTMHNSNLKLANGVEEAAFACRSLATRLGGNPLEPSRCHVLVGESEDKEHIKSSMEELIADRRRWWSNRQLVTLDPEPHEPIEVQKEAIAHDAALERLRRSMDGDMKWVEEDAAVKLQSAHRGNSLRQKLQAIMRRKQQEQKAVTVLQRMARGHAARVRVAQKKKLLKAAVKIQSVARGRQARKQAGATRSSRVIAALRIQRSMRASTSRKSLERGATASSSRKSLEASSSRKSLEASSSRKSLEASASRKSLERGSLGGGAVEASPTDVIERKSEKPRRSKSKTVRSDLFGGLDDVINPRASEPDAAPAVSVGEGQHEVAVAAKKIQAGFRQRISRRKTAGDAESKKRSTETTESQAAAKKIQAGFRNRLKKAQTKPIQDMEQAQQRKQSLENPESSGQEAEAAQKIQRRFRNRMSKKCVTVPALSSQQEENQSAEISDGNEKEAAVKKIQAGFRRRMSRKLVGPPAQDVQQTPPGKQADDSVESRETEAAAKKIQAGFRRRMSQKLVSRDAIAQNAKTLEHAQRHKPSETTTERKNSTERISAPTRGEEKSKMQRSKSKRMTSKLSTPDQNSSKASTKSQKQGRSSNLQLPRTATGTNISSSSTAGPGTAHGEQSPPEACSEAGSRAASKEGSRAASKESAVYFSEEQVVEHVPVDLEEQVAAADGSTEVTGELQVGEDARGDTS